MAQITKSNGSPTVYSLRRALGLKAKRPSGRNACIGSKLSGIFYETPPEGMGGRNNEAVRESFKAAVLQCVGMNPLDRLAAQKAKHETKRASAKKTVGVKVAVPKAEAE